MAKRAPKKTEKSDTPKRTRRSDTPDLISRVIMKYDEILLDSANLDDVLGDLNVDMSDVELRAVTKSLLKGAKDFNLSIGEFTTLVKDNVRSGAFLTAFLTRAEELKTKTADQLDRAINAL